MAVEVATAYVSLMPSMKGFSPAVKKELSGVENSVSSATTKAGAGIGSRMAGALGKAVKVGAIGAGVAAGAALVGGFKSAIDQQTASMTLEGLYGSAKKAKTTMEGLAKVSKTSPIEYSAYTKAAQSLAYAGVEGKKSIGILKNVGLAITASGGDSSSMDSATDAILKMVNAGKVQLDTLQQLSGAGVPILSGLAKHYGKSMAEVNKMASEGQIQLEDVLSVMQNATGKTFKQMQAAGKEASGSFGNQWKIAKDNINTALGKAMLPLLKALTPAIHKLGQAAPRVINNIARVVTPVAKVIGEKLGGAIEKVIGLFKNADYSSFGGFLSSMKEGTGGASAWGDLFGRIVGVFSKLGPIASGAGKAILGFFEGLAPAFDEIGKALPKIGSAVGGALGKALGFIADNIGTIIKLMPLFVAGFVAYKAAAAASAAADRALLAAQLAMTPAMITNNALRIAAAAAERKNAAATVQSTTATTANTTTQKLLRMATLRGMAATIANTAKTLAYAAATKVVAAGTKAWAIAQRLLNAVMRMSPIGLIITGITLLVAALVWFFTKTKTGRKIIAAAWAGIKRAIKAVGDWFVKKLWPSLKRVISALGAAFKVVGRVIARAWANIRRAISVAWKGYIKPALTAMWRFIEKVLVPIVKFLWARVVKPVFKSIGWAVKHYISGVVVPVLKTMWKFVKNVLIPILKFLWTRVVKPVFKGIGSAISAVWNHVIKPVFEGMKKFVSKTLPNAFRAGRDGIKRIWTTLKNIVKTPVNFIIGTIYMKGIRKLFNALPLPEGLKLPVVHQFAKGGSVTGGQKGKDSVPAMMMPGEHVLTSKEVRKLGGQASVYRMRELIRSGGLTVKELVKDKPTTSSSGKRKGDIGWPAKDENVPGFAKGGGLTQKQIDRGLRFARAQVGKPYIWGGVGPAGYDCSGMMSAVTNAIAGRNPYSRIGTSSTFPWGGFKPGWGEWTVGAFTGSPGHVAGTLTGTNIESTNGSVRMGRAARGAGDSLFTRIAHLGAAGSAFAGMSGSAAGGGIPFGQTLHGGATVSSWKDSLTAIPKFIGKIRGWMSKVGNSPIWKLLKAALRNAGSHTVDFFNDKIPDSMGPIPMPDDPIPNPFGTEKMSKIKWGDLSRSITAGLAGAKAAGGAKQYAKALLKANGWSGQFGALDALWTKESGWNPHADNPSSTAYGIPQMLTGLHSLPADYKTNPKSQVRAGLNYIRQRYGSPAKAWAHSQAHGWYAGGLTGGIFNKPTTIGVGENGPERVDITPLTSGLGRTSLKATRQGAGYARATVATGNGGSNTKDALTRRYAMEITNWDEGTGYIAEIAQEEIAGDNALDRQILRANR